MTTLFDKLKNSFNEHFGSLDNACFVRAPGRVNLIGEHTDYNDEFVLPLTIDRAVYFILRPRSDKHCQIYSVNFAEITTWDLDTISKTTEFSWSNYIKGMMQMMLDAGYKISGVEGVVYGDVPIGSGLSSSAALEIATAYAVQKIFMLDLPAIKMIQLAQKAENNFIGVNCGIMDQFVSRLGKENQALFIDCRTLEYKNIPIELSEHKLLIADTKIKRQLAKSAYNERCAECALAVEYFKTLCSEVKKIRDVDFAMLERGKSNLSEKVFRRANHVVHENNRVIEMIKALGKNDMNRAGELLFSSHQSLRDDYEVSCAELDFLVDTSKELGALGARLTGAGFGGAVLILAKKQEAEFMSAKLHEEYRIKFDLDLEVMVFNSNLEAGVIDL